MKLESLNPPKTEEQKLMLIKQHCKQICKLYKKTGLFFFRGTTENKPFFNTSISDRNPTHTDRIIHDLAVQYMKQLGFVAHRGNSTFIQNTKSFDYGDEMYVVFPLDGFKYSWSRSIRDFYINTPLNDKDLNRIFSSAQSFQSFYQYTDKDLEEALIKKHEVLIQGNYYLYSFDTKINKYEYQPISTDILTKLKKLMQWIQNENN